MNSKVAIEHKDHRRLESLLRLAMILRFPFSGINQFNRTHLILINSR